MESAPSGFIETQSSWVQGHHYGGLGILLSVNLVLQGLSSFRGASTILGLLSPYVPLELPGYSSIRNWFLRVGLYELKRPRPLRNDWIYIVDITLEVGVQKCLVVLGIAQTRWQELVREHAGKLTYGDVELLGLQVLSQSTGEAVHTLLETISQQVGVARQIVSDQGRDLQKGIRLYTQEHESVQVSDDVTHYCARLLKTELGADEDYQAFAHQCRRSRRQLQQTPLSFLMPPVQRAKARYMNIDTLLEWAERVVNYEHQQDFSLITPVHCLDDEALANLDSQVPPEVLVALDSIKDHPFAHRLAFEHALNTCLPDVTGSAVGESIRQASDRGKRYFTAKLGWVAETVESLCSVTEMLTLVTTLQSQLKQQGLTAHSTAEFLNRIHPFEPTLTSRAQTLKTHLIEYLDKQTQTLPDDTTWLATSDIIESLFGKYKLFSEKSPLKHMGHLLLSLPLLTANLSTQLVRTALETISFDDVQQWYHDLFGQSPLAKRRQAFQAPKLDTEVA